MVSCRGFRSQHGWALNDVLQALYPNQNEQKKKEKFDAVHERIQEVHQEIWPGIATPAIYKIFQSGKNKFRYFLPTSWFVATLVWGVTATKRSRESMDRCENLLEGFIQMSILKGKNEVSLSFPIFKNDGSFSNTDQVVGHDLVIKPFDPEMLAADVVGWWARSQATYKWPKTPITSPSLVDFILWVLRPVAGIGRSLESRKGLLTRTVRPILAKLAYCADTDALPELLELSLKCLRDVDRIGDDDDSHESWEEFVTVPHQKRPKRDIKRQPQYIISEQVARAAQLLFHGREPRLHFFGGNGGVEQAYQGLLSTIAT